MPKKFTLTLNSHSLSAFQECESKYLFSNVFSVQPLGSTKKMDRGTLYAKFLEVHYKYKIKPRQSYDLYLDNIKAWKNRLTKVLGCDFKEALYTYNAMEEYREHYKNELWIPLAVEKGFSKVIYEDADNLFIYEGRPDLVLLSDPINRDLLICDHKTQGRKDSFYTHNNQSYGYMWNYEASRFVYNYIVFNKDIDFRRESALFSPNQVEAWKGNTIDWFFRVKAAMQKEHFNQSWQCQGRWSLCPFTLVCERPNYEHKLITLKTNYTTKKPYRSW